MEAVSQDVVDLVQAVQKLRQAHQELPVPERFVGPRHPQSRGYREGYWDGLAFALELLDPDYEDDSWDEDDSNGDVR